jgi:hypothetical protein
VVVKPLRKWKLAYSTQSEMTVGSTQSEMKVVTDRVWQRGGLRSIVFGRFREWRQTTEQRCGLASDGAAVGADNVRWAQSNQCGGASIFALRLQPAPTDRNASLSAATCCSSDIA